MKIFVNGTKYLSIILLLTGLTVRVAGDGDCDNVNITGIIEEQDKEEMDLMKDAFWSLGGKPYPNMQNPTVAYVHFAHCRKVQKDYLNNGSDENKKAFDAQSDEEAVKARIKMEKKHFEHCKKLLKKTKKSNALEDVLEVTNDYNETTKTDYCLDKFNHTLSTKAGWYFRYSYFLYFSYTFSISRSSIEKTSIENIAADNFGKYIMKKKKELTRLEKKYLKEMKADSVKKQYANAYYCQPEDL